MKVPFPTYHGTPSEEDMASLELCDADTLARISCQINAWEWPEELANPEPTTHIPGGRRGVLIGYIDRKIGLRATLKYWNTVFRKKHNTEQPAMTVEEFDKWYEETFSAD